VALVKYNNNSISNVTTTALATGSLVPIKTLTASSSSTLSFVDGSNDVVLDSTYPIYKFEFINAHPSTNNSQFSVNFRDGGSLFDATKTTTHFRAYHDESDTATSLGYEGSLDLAQSTGIQPISGNMSNDNDSGVSGELYLFNPSSTTFVKHFISKVNYQGSAYSINSYLAGYCNTTTSIDGVQFSYSSGNIDSGTIKLYGIKDS